MSEGSSSNEKSSLGPNIIMWVGVMALVFAPALFTLPALLTHFNFSETGQIGDTIGGITAPFINLTAAILVYYSFREQFKANQIQRDALNEEKKSGGYERQYTFILSLVQNLDERINLFTYPGTDGETKRGASGIQYFVNLTHTEYKKGQDTYSRDIPTMRRDEALSAESYSEVYQTVRIAAFIADKIDRSSIPLEMKKDCFERLDITYSSSLESSLQTFSETYPEDSYPNTTINEIKQNQKEYTELRKAILPSS